MTRSQSPALSVIHCLATILGEQKLRPNQRQVIIEHIGIIESAILEDKVPAHYHFDALLKELLLIPACQHQVRLLAEHFAYLFHPGLTVCIQIYLAPVACACLLGCVRWVGLSR